MTKVHIEPADFVRKLQQMWSEGHASADVPKPDLADVAKPDLKLILCLLHGTTYNTTDEAEYRAQAQALGLPVSTFGPSKDGTKYVVGPASTLNAMIEASKSRTDLIVKTSKEVNAVIFVLLGTRDGIMANGTPREDLTNTSIEKYKQLFSAQKCSSKCGLPAIQVKKDTNAKEAIVGKTCWDTLRKLATDKIDADAKAKAAADAKAAEDAMYDRPVSARDLEKWIRDCGAPNLKIDGKWANSDLKALRGVFEGGDTSQIKTRTSKNRTMVAVAPKGTVDKVKACARKENRRRANEAAERKRLDELAKKKRRQAREERDAAKKKRLEEEARLAEEAKKRKEQEEADREAKRKAAEEAAQEKEVLPTDNEQSAADKPTNGGTTNGGATPTNGGGGGTVVVGLLAGLAGLGMVLFAAQKKKKPLGEFGRVRFRTRSTSGSYSIKKEIALLKKQNAKMRKDLREWKRKLRNIKKTGGTAAQRRKRINSEWAKAQREWKREWKNFDDELEKSKRKRFYKAKRTRERTVSQKVRKSNHSS
jgi:hypothetical protein